MNAVNPAPSTPAADGDQRLYEPSMEEILASIRRIIADDQMLPGRLEPRDTPPIREKPAPVEDAVAPASSPRRNDEPTAFVQVPPRPAAPLPRSEAIVPEPSTMSMAPHDQVSAPQSPNPFEPVPAQSDVPKPAVGTPAAVPAVADQIAAAAHAEVSPEEASKTKPVTHEAEVADDEGEADDVDPYFDPPIERDEPLPTAEPPAGLFSPDTKQSVTSAFNILAATRLADNSEELLGLAREMIRPLLKTWLDDNLPRMVERMVRAEIERVARGGR